MKPKTKCIGARIFTETKQDKGKSYGEVNVGPRQLRLLVRLAFDACGWEIDQGTDQRTLARVKRTLKELEAIKKGWAL